MLLSFSHHEYFFVTYFENVSYLALSSSVLLVPIQHLCLESLTYLHVRYFSVFPSNYLTFLLL